MVPGIEIIYLFNGFTQMPATGVKLCLSVVESVLLQLLEGNLADVIGQRVSVRAYSEDDAFGMSPCEGGGGSVNQEVADSSQIHLQCDGRLHSSISTLAQLEDRGDVDVDDCALLVLLQGALLAASHASQSTIEAEECFRWIVDNQKHISRNKYCVPFAMYELGVLLGGPTGLSWLHKAQHFKSDFNFKYRLHLRLHLASIELRQA